jgi:hypothetical protein
MYRYYNPVTEARGEVTTAQYNAMKDDVAFSKLVWTDLGEVKPLTVNDPKMEKTKELVEKSNTKE